MNRRAFLSSLAATGVAGVLSTKGALSIGNIPDSSKGSLEFDENMMVFLSDPHVYPGSYQTDYMRLVVQDILAMYPRPKNVVVFGDLAWGSGQTADYTLFRELIKPIEQIGIQITITMGNHDHRVRYREIYPEYAERSLVKDRMVYIVQTPWADLILLDTLHQGKDEQDWPVAGTIDDTQKEWLKKTLENYKKPVFVGAHHPVHELGIGHMLMASPTCCGFIHGHDHRWYDNWMHRDYDTNRMVRTLCLPSTGHWGDIGYTVFRLEERQAVATLHEREFFFPRPKQNIADIPQQWKDIQKEHDGDTIRFEYKTQWGR